jgi:hypothetical protein
VDVVELLAEHPLVFRVVDLEAAVGGDVVRLDGGEVGAQDIRLWILLGCSIKEDVVRQNRKSICDIFRQGR